MLLLDKKSALKRVAPRITANFLILEVDILNFGVLLQDTDQKPPLDAYVELTPENLQQAMRWKKGTKIYATVKSEICTIEEKVKEIGGIKGWTREMCDKVLKETGSSWNDAVVQYYFEDNIKELS